MNRSKLVRLERLQRLRETGALTTEEFEREKAALLTQAAHIWWVAGIAAVIVTAVVLAIVLTRNIPPRTAEPGANRTVVASSQPSPGASSTPAVEQDVRDQPLHEQMIAAFRAAFGRSPPAKVATNDATRIFRPKRLMWLGERAVLLSEGANTSECHACTGSLAIHYLVTTGQRFKMTGAWLDLVEGAGWGSPPQWQISTKLASYPAIVNEGGFTAQGCTSGGLTITELRPERPILSELIRTTMSNDSGFGDPDQIEGHITNVQRGHSFDVQYTGTRRFTERWVYRGGRFVLQDGPTKMPQC
jgi:hypothetical protein